MNEEWRYIDHPIIMEGRYMVSNFGRILNTKSKKLLKCNNPENNGGYITIALKCFDGKIKKFLLHRIVLGTFKGYSDMEVNHIDGNKTNNDIRNLEYVSRLENAQHAVRHNLYQRGADRHNAILDDDKVRKICSMLCEGLSPIEIIRTLDLPREEMSLRTVYTIFNRKTWTHISKDYDWDINRIKYKTYDYDDILEMCNMAVNTKMNSAQIAREFPQYNFKRLKNTIKKIRQGKLYKEIVNIVVSSSTIESIATDDNLVVSK